MHLQIGAWRTDHRTCGAPIPLSGLLFISSHLAHPAGWAIAGGLLGAAATLGAGLSSGGLFAIWAGFGILSALVLRRVRHHDSLLLEDCWAVAMAFVAPAQSCAAIICIHT